MALANPQRGETAFTAADGADYVLRYDLNAVCALEDELGGAEAFQDAVAAPNTKTIRLLVWAGLQARHPDVDLKTAGALFATMAEAAAVVSKAVEASFGAGDESKNKAAAAGN